MIGEQVPVQQEQEVHGPQRSHEKEFLVENKQCYDNTIGKKNKNIISILTKEWAFIC